MLSKWRFSIIQRTCDSVCNKL